MLVSCPYFTPVELALSSIYPDGIVNVSAKDKATNKDQSMTIASSSGLSDKDIERMVEESEKFAETDKERRNVIEEANKADSVSAETEKGMSFDVCLVLHAFSLSLPSQL